MPTRQSTVHDLTKSQIAIMVPYTRIDSANKHRPFRRKLSIQLLEQRIVLSASTAGGFVDLGNSYHGSLITYDINTSALQIPSDGIIFLDTDQIIDDIDIPLTSSHNHSDGHGNFLDDLDIVDDLISDLDPKVIDPPDTLPPDTGGGMVPISGIGLTEQLPVS